MRNISYLNFYLVVSPEKKKKSGDSRQITTHTVKKLTGPVTAAICPGTHNLSSTGNMSLLHA